jgi:hypothetical protein
MLKAPLTILSLLCLEYIGFVQHDANNWHFSGTSLEESYNIAQFGYKLILPGSTRFLVLWDY